MNLCAAGKPRSSQICTRTIAKKIKMEINSLQIYQKVSDRFKKEAPPGGSIKILDNGTGE